MNMQFFEVTLPPDVIRLLDAAQTARVLSIMRSWRCPTIESLPEGPHSVVKGIILDAEMRRDADQTPPTKVRRYELRKPKKRSRLDDNSWRALPDALRARQNINSLCEEGNAE